MVFVDAELVGYRLGYFTPVACKHDATRYACIMKVFDGLRGIFFDGVGDDDMPCVFPRRW